MHWLCLEFPRALGYAMPLLERLIAAGADVTLRNAAGKTPADIVRDSCPPSDARDVALGLLLSAPAARPPIVAAAAAAQSVSDADARVLVGTRAAAPAKKMVIKLKKPS